MTVKLLSITEPYLKDHNDNKLTAEQFIAYTARVSNPSNQLNTETSSKLLNYLIKHKHWSPFEMVHVTIEIKTSRGIAAQILRHRSFSFQEYSQRYAKATSYIEYPARRQDVKNRQNSIDDLDTNTQHWFKTAQKDIWNFAEATYEMALEKGIAKEQARFLLPLNTETTVCMSGSVRSWLHYIDLRCENGTQLEHRQIAEACKEIFKEHFPETAKAMNWKSNE